MQFESVSAFLEMGGYGFFVWLAFGVSFAAMLALVAETFFSRRKLRQHIEAENQRRQRIAEHKAAKRAKATNEVTEA